MRGLGLTGARRVPNLPDVPTMIEAGMSGFEIYSWHGYLAPSGTPEPILAKLETEIRTAARNPRVHELFPATELIGSSRTEFAEFLRRDTEVVRRLLRNLGTVRNG
jgi:tripartite-type tricarboxylate transporter receptor subunit TctC